MLLLVGKLEREKKTCVYKTKRKKRKTDEEEDDTRKKKTERGNLIVRVFDKQSKIVKKSRIPDVVE